MLDVGIRVLGCSGSIAAGERTTAFLLDGRVLLDAGTGVGDLTIEEMAGIDHILLSHSHLDHVLGIPLLADTVLRRRLAERRPPIQVHALPQTIEVLRRHLFNDLIWPDFTRLPSPEQPALQLQPFEVGRRLVLGERCVEVLPARHSVPAVGFAVFPRADGGGPAWVYSGDTGPNPALWKRLEQLPVASLVIETAFGDDDAELAKVSGHLHPAALAEQLQQLALDVAVHITHAKPGELQAIMGELGRHACSHRVRALQRGQEMTLLAAP